MTTELSVRLQKIKFVQANHQLAVAEGSVIVQDGAQQQQSNNNHSRRRHDGDPSSTAATAINATPPDDDDPTTDSLRHEHSHFIHGEPCHLVVRSKSHVGRLFQHDQDIRQEVCGDNRKSTGSWIGLDDNDSSEPVFVRLQTLLTMAIERNRRGVKLIECHQVIAIGCDLASLVSSSASNSMEKQEHRNATANNNSPFVMYDKSKRHELFVQWLLNKYGKERLCRGSGVLDVAGGKGELSMALRAHGIPSVILDPHPRLPADWNIEKACTDTESQATMPPIHVIAHSLGGDGRNLLDPKVQSTCTTSTSTNAATLSSEERHWVESCSILSGMHPDQATEPILGLAAHLEKDFAILPCCVMPSLFPKRRYQNQPVRSYRVFCHYLQNLQFCLAADGGAENSTTKKKNKTQVDYLPFIGRNMILYSASYHHHHDDDVLGLASSQELALLASTSCSPAEVHHRSVQGHQP